jgi:hypothetical protein
MIDTVPTSAVAGYASRCGRAILPKSRAVPGYVRPRRSAEQGMARLDSFTPTAA